MAITKQISIRIKEEVLAEIDAEAARLGLSRNLVISRRVEKLPPLYGMNRETGSISEITPEGWVEISAPEKIAESVPGATPSLPPMGKSKSRVGFIRREALNVEAEKIGSFRGMGKCPHGYVSWMVCRNEKGGCE